MTLAADIITELTNEWGITPIPDFLNKKYLGMGENDEQVLVDTKDPTERPYSVGASPLYRIETNFTLEVEGYVVEAQRDAAIVEIKRIIRAKVISSGWWEILGAPEDDGDNTHGSRMKGIQILVT